MFIVRDREAGNVIEKVDTLAQAYALVAVLEEGDIADGIYEPFFYEIYETVEGERESITRG